MCTLITLVLFTTNCLFKKKKIKNTNHPNVGQTRIKPPLKETFGNISEHVRKIPRNCKIPLLLDICWIINLLSKRDHTKYSNDMENTKDKKKLAYDTGRERKNPAYGRHQLSRPMRIVGPIQI